MDGEVACAVIIQLKLQRCHLTGSTKSRNPESGKQNRNPETGNRKPETGIQKKLQDSAIRLYNNCLEIMSTQMLYFSIRDTKDKNSH